VPPNSCARAILIDSYLLKFIGFVACKLRDADQKIVEKRRHCTGRFDSAAAVIILKAKAADPAISNMSVEFKRLQVQFAERSDECSFLFFGYYLLPITRTPRLRFCRSHFHLVEQCILPSNVSIATFLRVRGMAGGCGGPVSDYE
jgi:hypothetical protein